VELLNAYSAQFRFSEQDLVAQSLAWKKEKKKKKQKKKTSKYTESNCNLNHEHPFQQQASRYFIDPLHKLP